MPVGNGNVCPRSHLTKKLKHLCNQVWYADDGTGGDKFVKLKAWWDALVKEGPRYGYFPKAEKTWLITSEDKLEEAKKVFDGSGVQITAEGMRHLGAVIGSKKFRDTYITKKIQKWTTSVEKLSKIAVTQPHAAYSAFTRNLQSQWVSTTRTVVLVNQLE